MSEPRKNSLGKATVIAIAASLVFWVFVIIVIAYARS